MREITYEQYYNKVLGCWIGKTLGGCGGVPFEGIKKRIENIDFKQIINTTLPNDDFDMQVMWLQGLEEKGPYLTSENMAQLWEQVCKYPWSEYGYFMKNHRRGIKAPYSGWFNNEFFKNGMGCPIRSEIWAISFPGMPDLAGEMAMKDAKLDHADNSMWGERFLAQLESMLFVTDDILAVIEECVQNIDKTTNLYRCLYTLLDNYKNGVAFDDNLEFIYKNYSHNDFTNSTQNIAIAILGVLHGDLDMEKTINITLIGGYDADCTCATAGAIVGIVIGEKAIPQKLKDLIHDSYVCAVDVQRKDNRITTFAQDCARIGVSMVKHLNSGHVDITQLPPDYSLIHWNPPTPLAELRVEYDAMPAIGANDICPISVYITNHSSLPLNGKLEILELKDGWQADFDKSEYSVPCEAEIKLPVRIVTGDLKMIAQTNILQACFVGTDGTKLSQSFGVAGAAPYRLYGPFFEAPDWESDSSWPKSHGGDSQLPSILSMVHNEVFLDKEYLDEKAIRNDPKSYQKGLAGTIYAKEDVVPIEENLSIVGECGFILVCDVIFEQDTEAWVVIGNTDGFKIYLNGKCCISKDEHFLWTPINNAFIGQFKKGGNRLMIKLLRRTDEFKFSMGFKEYNNKHYHQTFWLDNLTFEII